MVRQRWAVAVLAFLAAEAVLRLLWIAGGRWGYTACERTALPADPGGGCGADAVTSVPFRDGWGPLLAAVLLAVLVAVALRRPGRAVAAVLWPAAAVLGVAAFPLHLLFEVPAALAGRPSDWRDLLGRLALTVGAVLLARLAVVAGPGRAPVAPGYRAVPRWARRCAYAAVALPVVGWALPHTLWLLGVPFGISAGQLADIDRDLAPAVGAAITVVPPLAGLLVLGLVQPWGQVFPRWVPVSGGRRVPPLLALVPAGVVALALITYGGLSVAVVVRGLADGTTTGSDLVGDWAVTATLLVFAGWGVALGGAAAGYHRATRADRPATGGDRAAHGDRAAGAGQATRGTRTGGTALRLTSPVTSGGNDAGRAASAASPVPADAGEPGDAGEPAAVGGEPAAVRNAASRATSSPASRNDPRQTGPAHSEITTRPGSWW